MKKIFTYTINSSLGQIIIGELNKKICFIEYLQIENIEQKLLMYKQIFKANFKNQNSEIINSCINQLNKYFSGNLKTFKLPLHLEGTNFQLKVWQELMNIKYANTISYTQQAENIGNHKAIRAVAKTNSYNKLSIVVPCHRVIGKNGKLTGYAGGLWRKKYLLDLEKQNNKIIKS